MMKSIQEFFLKQISPDGLAIFRITYCLVLLFELLHIFKFRELYFNNLPYLNPQFLNTGLLLSIWIGCVLLLVIGYKTFIFSVINYVFGLVFISTAVAFEYHMFYVYTGINFLLIFLPISNTLSLDFFCKKKIFLGLGKKIIPKKVSKINYYLPILVGLALVYFDSAYYFKLRSPMWLSGLGLWLPSSLPYVTISDVQWFLNEESLMKFLSYLTLAFELLFIFIFWFKRFRVPLFFLGISFHIGIYVLYPIPYFSLGCISLYSLILPVHYWDEIWVLLLKQLNKYKLFRHKSERSLVLSNYSIFNKWNSYFIFFKDRLLILFLILAIVAQIQGHKNFFSSSNTNWKVNVGLTKYVGVALHPVFMDSHFKNYNNIYTLKYLGKFLPIINEKGMPDEYLQGGTFINWAYRVNKPNVSQNSNSLDIGFRNYSAFWAHKNGINLSEAKEFEIVKKSIVVPETWKKDVLKDNINLPWESVGKLVWKNNQSKLIWNSSLKNN